MATPSLEHYKQQRKVLASIKKVSKLLKKMKVLNHIKKLSSDYFRDIVWGDKLWSGTKEVLCLTPNPIIAKRLIKEIEHYNDVHCETHIEYFVKEETAVWMTGISYEVCSYCDASNNECVIHEIIEADLSPEDTEMMLEEGIGYYCDKCEWHGGQY